MVRRLGSTKPTKVRLCEEFFLLAYRLDDGDDGVGYEEPAVVNQAAEGTMMHDASL